MFDTIELKSPLVCPGCGAESHSIQTHEFDDVMATYQIGSVVRGSSVISGILHDTLWCSACHEAGKDPTPVYLVIWHSVLVGVEQDLGRAEERLRSVDRLDLIGWLDEAQRDALQWKRRFHALHSDFGKWHEHINRADDPEAAAGTLKSLARLWRLPDEILEAPDPLAALLEKHSSDSHAHH